MKSVLGRLQHFHKDPDHNADVSHLWVNPVPSAFGLVEAPSTALMNGAGGELSQLASFALFNPNSSEPTLFYADELRIGTSWASVTSPAANETVPTLVISYSSDLAILSWTTNAPGFALEATPDPPSPVHG